MRTASLVVNIASLCGVIVAASVGCASTGVTDRSSEFRVLSSECNHPELGTRHSRLTPGLVTPGALLLTMAGEDIDAPDWEVARNDVPRRTTQPAGVFERSWLEVRHREHLRIINGRPGEFTATTTRSIRRRVE